MFRSWSAYVETALQIFPHTAHKIIHRETSSTWYPIARNFLSAFVVGPIGIANALMHALASTRSSICLCIRKPFFVIAGISISEIFPRPRSADPYFFLFSLSRHSVINARENIALYGLILYNKSLSLDSNRQFAWLNLTLRSYAVVILRSSSLRYAEATNLLVCFQLLSRRDPPAKQPFSETLKLNKFFLHLCVPHNSLRDTLSPAKASVRPLLVARTVCAHADVNPPYLRHFSARLPLSRAHNLLHL